MHILQYTIHIQHTNNLYPYAYTDTD